MFSSALMITCSDCYAKKALAASCTASVVSSVRCWYLLFFSMPCKQTRLMRAILRLTQVHLLCARLEKLCIKPPSQTKKQLL